MDPIIELSIGGSDLALSAYRLMLLAAVVATIVVARLTAVRVGIPVRSLTWVVAGSAVGAVLGARLLAVVTTVSPNDDPWSRLFSVSAGDFALYGGLIGGGLAGWVLCQRLRLSPLRSADALAPALGAGIVLMRVGCLLSGCCFGNPTHLLWGITYPSGSPAHVHHILSGDSIFTTISGPVAVHPFPVYDMAAGLSAGVLAWIVSRRNWAPGSGMAVFVLWYSSWRLVLTPFRADTGTSALPGWFWPAVFAVAAVGSASWLASQSTAMSRRRLRPAIVGLVLVMLLSACGEGATIQTLRSSTTAPTVASVRPASSSVLRPLSDLVAYDTRLATAARARGWAVEHPA